MKIKIDLKELFTKKKKLKHYKPESLNDPVAQKTQWTPLVTGGSNFKTHKLITGTNSLRFVPSAAAHISSIILIGFFMVFFVSLFTDSLIPLENKNIFLHKALCVIIFFALIYSVYIIYQPRVFDLRNNIFRNSWVKPEISVATIDTYHCVKFNEIHALQLIEEYIKDGDYSFELNLILKDASRVNVIDHGDKFSIKKDAKKISRLINVPLWSNLCE